MITNHNVCDLLRIFPHSRIESYAKRFFCFAKHNKVHQARQKKHVGKVFLLDSLKGKSRSQPCRHGQTSVKFHALSIVVDASGGLVLPVGGVVREGFGAHAAHLERIAQFGLIN